MNPPHDAFDELAAMFLTAPHASPLTGGTASTAGVLNAGRATRGRTTSPSGVSAISTAPLAGDAEPTSIRTGRATTELLISGHLPVRGGLWLTPYADLAARERGSTALLRLDGPEPSVQLLRAPMGLATIALPDTLVGALRQVSAAVDHWIIRAPAGADAEELLHSGADGITILSSADEAATVAAYQVVKELAQAASQRQRTLPPVSLAIVGADAACAAAVIDRLNRTTLSFLGVDIQLAACLPRIDAGIKSTRYASFAQEPAPSLGHVFEAIQQPPAQRARPIGGGDADRAVVGRLYPQRQQAVMNAQEILSSVPSAPAVQTRGSNANLTGAPSSNAPSHAPSQDEDDGWIANGASSPAAAAPMKLPPKPAIDLEPKHTARPTEPDDDGRPVPLARYVQDLIPLPVRPPGHERVELAVDRAGRLHLLARDAAGNGLREMRIVESWANRHRELLAMACPQQTINSAVKAACHVFTDRPAALADLHGTGLLLHVLAPVQIDGQTAWYAAALNNAD